MKKGPMGPDVLIPYPQPPETHDMVKLENSPSFHSHAVPVYLNLALHRPMTSPWQTSSALNSDPSRVR